jgi:hypothetical protein
VFLILVLLSLLVNSEVSVIGSLFIFMSMGYYHRDHNIHKESSTACTRSFDMGSTSAEGKKVVFYMKNPKLFYVKYKQPG